MAKYREKLIKKVETGYAGTDHLSEGVPKGTYWVGDNQAELVKFNEIEKIFPTNK